MASQCSAIPHVEVPPANALPFYKKSVRLNPDTATRTATTINTNDYGYNDLNYYGYRYDTYHDENDRHACTPNKPII